MNILSKPVIMVFTTIGVLFAAPALGAGEMSNVYLGIGAGVANLKDDVRLNDLGDIRFNDDSTAYKVFGGYRATENFAVEGGYRDFGKAESGPFSIKTDGFDVAAVGILPVGPVELLAKAGIIFWDANAKSPVPDDSGEDLMYGVGGQMNLGSLFFRLESEWFDMNFSDNTQMISGSVGWRF